MGYLAKIGSVAFTLKAFEFDEYKRTKSWNWASVSVLNSPPRLHFGEIESDKISLLGRVFEDQETKQFIKLEELRQLGDKGQPLPLTYASERAGQYLGLWVIKSLEEKRILFHKDGTPKEFEFTLELAKYHGD